MKHFAGALFAGLCSVTALSASAQEITASIWFPDTYPLVTDGYQALARTLEEKSGGELSLKVYTGDSVLPPGAHLSGLRDGIVDMTYHAGTYTPSDLPADNVLAALGISFNDSMVLTAAVADFYLNDAQMQEMFRQQGVVFLGSYASPSYALMCTSPVVTLDDIAGKKIRMPSPIHAAWAASVDAAAVNVPSSEMFTGLEKGQLDCAANSPNDLKSRSLWDVAKEVTLLDLGQYFAGWQYAMNQPAWSGLSEANRQLLVDSISDNLVTMTTAFEQSVDEALAEAGDHGVTVHEPGEDLQASLDSFVAEQVAPMAAEVAGRLNVEGAEDLIARFNAVYEKWEGLLADVDRSDTAALQKVFKDEIYGKVDVASYGVN
ncbi:C4-dicarboxylate TRAP transporter substrate-binding protein [Sulfitobacter sp. PR48]|uniref:C4-dicarboxylate TRAP transporter substrate-binding protein n=1 Tax=Sulfitobacter sp. PR48 TaxID=3028383 RepID=UPI00237A5A7D|nr:C4-dicarboxylate TRAP transporter substrate-binding protein [Sulfitobacter sp. PR48]MDD9721074.1 C4-dicarboxylate TRAP transporter substrate-binding protein [Sulfitobacter sp. PR48]